MNLLNFLLLLSSHFISLWLESILCILSIFPFLLRVFNDLPHGLSLWMIHVCLRRMCIVLLWGGLFYSMVVRFSWFSVIQVFMYLLISCLVVFYPFLKVGHWRFQPVLLNCLFLPSVCQFLLSYCGDSVVRCIYACKCDILLVGCSIYYY